MSFAKIFKKVIIPCAAGVTSKASAESHSFGANCVKKADVGTRPSDLPIYAKECVICREASQSSSSQSSMEETVGNIRKELWVWQDSLKGYRQKIVNVYRKSFSTVDFMIDYLREPVNGPHRIGAILVSGVAGYLMGLRKGRFRRIFYGTIGSLSMAAVCYPEQSMSALESVVLEGRRYFIVAYHFIFGESPKIPDWLEKLISPAHSKETEPLTVIVSVFIPEPEENTSDNWEAVPVEDKPAFRDCRCNPDPDDPRPCPRGYFYGGSVTTAALRRTRLFFMIPSTTPVKLCLTAEQSFSLRQKKIDFLERSKGRQIRNEDLLRSSKRSGSSK